MNKCPFHNILDPDMYAAGNHHAKLHEIMEQADVPLVKIDDPLTGVPYWAVTDRATADAVCKEPNLFSSEAQSAIPTEWDDEFILEQQRMMVVNMDPPKHNKYRRIARNAFTPKTVEAYRETFERYAKEIVDAVASKGECEFVEEVAAELPLMAILDLCGVPKEDRHQVFEWTNRMFFREDEDFQGDHSEDLAQQASAEIYLYADKLAQQHAENPQDNIVGALLDGTIEGEGKLTPEEFQRFFLLLISAGNESTRTVTAHAMRLLMENPDQLQMLVDDPELIHGAVEETLRFNPAFIGMRRTVMEDTELHGQQLKKGDKLMLNWHMINQDPEVFDDAKKFDITRFKRMPDLYRQHRAFGYGQHFCLGSHLARLEVDIMLREIIPRLRNPKFAGPVKYVRDNLVNGIKEMKITFDPEAA